MIGRGYSIRQMPRRRMTEYSDGWFVYTAFCPLDDAEVFIKVGVSTVPYTRLFSIHSNSPYPVELAFFTYAGTKKRALAIERGILTEFKAHKTRGEWLRMDTRRETKRAFALACEKLVVNQTGALPEWKRATGGQILAYAGLKLGERVGDRFGN